MNNMKNEKPTYTLWNGNDIVASYPHTREGMDAAMVRAHELTVGGYGKLSLYSSRDDLVWTSTNEEPTEPNDSWHDGDALASAGMGTDEDYGFYGEDCDW
jgi:hypothetical protein